MKWIHKRNIQIALLFLLVFLGTASGSVLNILHPEWAVWKNTAFRQGIGILTEQTFSCVLAPVFWLAVIAASGMSAAGMLITPCILFLRGAALGAVLEEFYLAENPLSGLLLIMPYAFMSSLIIILGVREAMRFSVQIAGLLCETAQEEEVSVKLYIIRFLILFLFLFLLGMLQNFLLIRFA